jgi:ketosteroid isomerase-like protein
MNILRLSVLLLLVSSCAADEAVQHDVMESEILAALDRQKEAWNQGDIEGFVSLYLQSDDLRFTTSRGMLSGVNEVMDRYKTSYENTDRMGQLDFKILDFQCIDTDHAILIGKWSVFREGDRPEGYFTLLWKRTDMGWRIAVDHTS